MRKLRRALMILLIALAVIISLPLYALLEFQNIAVTRLALNREELAGTKIVFAADFQYDMQWDDPQSIEGKTFQKAVDLIMKQAPDLILLGGDYITYVVNAPYAAPYLQGLQAPLGVYGIFGNHDTGAIESLKEALPNIRFLQNETVRIEAGSGQIILTGVEDMWEGTPRVDARIAAEEGYHILLTHNPDFAVEMAKEEREIFDLILAGHLHAGQVTIFGIAGIPRAMRYVSKYGDALRYGEKDVEGTRLYVTSGLGGGIFGVPVRFFARPEIVVMQ